MGEFKKKNSYRGIINKCFKVCIPQSQQKGDSMKEEKDRQDKPRVNVDFAEVTRDDSYVK